MGQVRGERGVVIQANVPGGIRTPNLLIRSQKLYPVELQALKTAIVERTLM